MAVFIGIMCAFTLTACSGGEAPETISEDASPSPAVAVEFVGTPADFMRAMKQCMERKGWETTDGTTGTTGYLVGNRTGEELISDSSDCNLELGPPPMTDVTDQELQERYNWRQEQYACLVEKGYEVGEEMSFNTFADNYLRIGYTEWDPISVIVHPPTITAAVADCPYSTNEW